MNEIYSKDYIDKIMNNEYLKIKIPDNISMYIGINNDCNCHCNFCLYKGLISYTKEKTTILSTKILYDYLNQLYPRVSELYLTYGEVTICREAKEYVKFLGDNYPNIRICIDTNGIAFTDEWANLASKYFMKVNFSINAINEEYFKKTVWERDGIYGIVQNNLNNFLELLEQNEISAFKPSVSMVINETNCETVREFIKQYVKKGIQSIYFYFDIVKYGFRDFKPETDDIRSSLITLVELERVLSDKVMISSRLFAPSNNLEQYYHIVQEMDIERLKEKYADILELTKNLPSLYELYIQRKLKSNKKTYLYTENEVKFLSKQQFLQMKKNPCNKPWESLILKPNGAISVCCTFPEGDNINNYIKNDSVDWLEVFNSFYYRNVRYKFLKGIYEDCVANCPCKKMFNEAEFKNYCIYGL